MPRHTGYALRWMAESQSYEMHIEGKPAPDMLVPGSDRWFDWLDQISSFSFQSRSGEHCTLRRETMRRGGAYWYS